MRRSTSPKPLTFESIPVSREGLTQLLQLARRYGPIPESCREALELEVEQLVAGVESQNVVVLHRSDRDAERRLQELRQELRNECISYGELAELESLRKHIEPDDIELLGALGDDL